MSGPERTGRTTRMLKRAIQRALTGGEDVVIVAEDLSHRRALTHALQKLPGFADIKGPGSIKVVAESEAFDWFLMRLRGGTPESAMVDHHVCECEIRRINNRIEGLVRLRDRVREIAAR